MMSSWALSRHPSRDVPSAQSSRFPAKILTSWAEIAGFPSGLQRMRRKEQPGAGASRQTPHSVLVVDDAEIIRRGIVAIISAEPDFSISGVAGDEAAAVRHLERGQTDLLLLDLSLGHRDGMQFLKDIAGRFSGIRIIALSDYGDPLYATRALRAGAAGYLTKHASATQLITTVRAAVAGDTLVGAPRNASQREVRPPAVSRALLTGNSMSSDSSARVSAPAG